jgi:cysteinyl-tRNA synthetase
VAYGIPEGGHNGNTSMVGERELQENFLPPFKAAITAGALLDGVMHLILDIRTAAKANRDFATGDKIRDELTKLGVVVKDTKEGSSYSLP